MLSHRHHSVPIAQSGNIACSSETELRLIFLQYCDLPPLITVEDRQTELRLIFLQYCDLPPLITVEDRQSLSSEKLAWPAVSSPTAEISVYQWLPLLQDFLQ